MPSPRSESRAASRLPLTAAPVPSVNSSHLPSFPIGSRLLMSHSGAGAGEDPLRNPMEVDHGPDDEGGGGCDAGTATTSSPSWRLDPLAFFCSSSSYSPPPQSLSFLPFPSPPSPLWLFEDGFGAMIAESQGLVAGNPDAAAGNGDGADAGVSWRLQSMPAEEGNSDRSCLIKERITRALRHFKESTDQHLLVQVWAPVRKGNRCVLTTSGQPFVLDPRSAGLLQYRMASVTYVFSADGDNDVELGLPGRVFRQKVPEWTPNVQYYSSKEYPRLLHALNFDVRGTLALPVFEPSAQSCVAVVELIMTSQKINYAGEVDKVCKALEAVNLKSSEILDHPNVQICNEGRQAALAEILQILTIVCEEHKLPLAQTWVPCMHRSVLTHGGGSKKSCSSFDGSCMGQVCMSTTDVAFHVIDGHMWGFREACVEHHLQKKQGVSGRSFASRRPFFCTDITQFCKTEYPLVHYARMFHLAGCFAVCLQSSHTGTDDYILEFFLPTDCKGADEQRALLKSITALMVNCFYSLKLITDGAQEEALQDVENDELEPKCINIWTCESNSTACTERIQGHISDLQNSEKLHSELSYQRLLSDSAFGGKEVNIVDSNGSGNCSSSLIPKNDKPPERKRGKAEKKISLEVLKQYFTGSLKDAAKSLGVCPTTMKRICRQHGITRWPSRKINKVNRSLSKLRRVIESVQGTDGAFNLTAYTGSLPVDVGSISWPVNLDGLTPNRSAKTPNLGERGEDDLNHSSDVGDQSCPQKEIAQNENITQLKIGNCSLTKSRSSSGHGSTQTPTSEGSCQESPVNETHVVNQLISSTSVRVVNGDSLESAERDQNLNIFASFPISDANVLEPRTESVGIVIQDSGSFKDLKDLCNLSAEGFHNEHVAVPVAKLALPIQMQDSRTVTLKACYKEDIIRFRMPCSAGVDVLRNEVAKRLKLEVGTFDVKYLDDDHEWVMLTGNADLEECMEISRREGGHLIRLLVSDTFVSLGSSCESSGG